MICIYFSNAQELIREKINKHAPEMVYIPGDVKNDPFFISRYEVRNKDYITYLSWLESVYRDYPEVYHDALPVNIKAEDYPEYLSGLYSYYRNNPEFYGESLPDTFIMHDYLFYQQESQANKYRENIFPICQKSDNYLMGFNNQVGEWVAETYKNEEIYHCVDLTKAKKDSLGIFPYIHFRDDKTGAPLFINKDFPGTKFTLAGNNTEIKGFRIAMSAYHINRQQSFNSIKEARANPEIVLMLVLFNDREDLPKNLGVFPNLRYLFIPAYKLSSFPTGITELRKMLHLTITKNELVKIPETIKNLKSLVHLDLSGNEIDQIPVQIAELNHLKYLNLSNNNLTRPGPEIMELNNLKHLNLKGNNLPESQKEIIRKWFYSGRGIDKSDSDYMLIL